MLRSRDVACTFMLRSRDLACPFMRGSRDLACTFMLQSRDLACTFMLRSRDLACTVMLRLRDLTCTLMLRMHAYCLSLYKCIRSHKKGAPGSGETTTEISRVVSKHVDGRSVVAGTDAGKAVVGAFANINVPAATARHSIESWLQLCHTFFSPSKGLQTK